MPLRINLKVYTYRFESALILCMNSMKEMKKESSLTVIYCKKLVGEVVFAKVDPWTFVEPTTYYTH